MKKKRFTVEQIWVCRSRPRWACPWSRCSVMWISEQAFYRWKKQYIESTRAHASNVQHASSNLDDWCLEVR